MQPLKLSSSKLAKEPGVTAPSINEIVRRRRAVSAEIRRAIGLTAGERVVLTQLDDGTTVFRANRRSIFELRGLLKPARGRKRPVALKDMNIGRR